jgi:hypothetical protein
MVVNVSVATLCLDTHQLNYPTITATVTAARILGGFGVGMAIVVEMRRPLAVVTMLLTGTGSRHQMVAGEAVRGPMPFTQKRQRPQQHRILIILGATKTTAVGTLEMG